MEKQTTKEDKMKTESQFKQLEEIFLNARREQNEKVRRGITGYNSICIQRTKEKLLLEKWKEFEQECFVLYRQFREATLSCFQLSFRCATQEDVTTVRFKIHNSEQTILRFTSNLSNSGFFGCIENVPQSFRELLRSTNRAWVYYMDQCAMVNDLSAWAEGIRVQDGNLVDADGNIVGSETAKENEETEEPK